MTTRELLDQALAEWRLDPARLVPLAGDVSHRSFYRVAGAGQVLMVTPPDEPNKVADWLAIRAWLADREVPVPALHAHHRPTGVLLIGDVGDRLLTEVAEPKCWYDQTVAALARVEALAAGEPATTSPAHARRLEEQRVRWELRRFRKIVAALVADLDDDERESWKRGEDRMVAALDAAPRAWMHRDLHARNLLVHDGRAWWVDFQDAMIGPWLYDLASLACDPYAFLDEPRRAAVREAYLGLPGRVHRGLGAAAVEALWDLVTVQRLVHCVACYVWVYEHFGRTLYLRFLPHAVGQLRGALARCPAAAPLAAVMDGRWDGVERRWMSDVVAG